MFCVICVNKLGTLCSRENSQICRRKNSQKRFLKKYFFNMHKYTWNTVRLFENTFWEFFLLHVGGGVGCARTTGLIRRERSRFVCLSRTHSTVPIKHPASLVIQPDATFQKSVPWYVSYRKPLHRELFFLRNSCLYSLNVISWSPSPSATLKFWVDSTSVLKNAAVSGSWFRVWVFKLFRYRWIQILFDI